ncbi:MAG: hypothetical protein ABMA25_02450 [Ilumatobacteraceae bacterium]
MRSIRWIRVGLVTCLVAAGLSAPRPASAAPGRSAPPAPGTLVPRPPADATGSDDIATAAADAPARPRLATELAAAARSGSTALVTVEVHGTDAEVAVAVQRAGGTLGRGGGTSYLATIPANRLSAVAASSGITDVRPPVSIEQMAASRPSTDGVEASSAPRVEGGWPPGGAEEAVSAWHRAGLKGAGSKVGIVALFDPALLATEVTQGELPVIPAGQRQCIKGGVACAFGSPGQTWGNSLAEIVNDMAPEATLYLAEIGYVPDYYSVIDWFAANGVQILLNPVVWPYDGPGNGTGPGAAIIDYAVSKGIAWFNTAGEMGVNRAFNTYQGGNWAGYWNDPNNNSFLNFSGTDESITVYCGSLMGLRWRDSSAVNTDYDLYISDFNIATRGNFPKKLLSANNQAAGAIAVEGNTGARLCNTNSAFGPVYDVNKDGFVSLWVKRTTRTASSPVGDLLQIGVYFGWMEYSTSVYAASIAFAESANPGMVAVASSGLSTANDWPGMSEGPTLDGRLKPELIAWGCITTRVDGVADYDCAHGFFGSDGAAAVQAAWAALARSGLGIQKPKDLMRYLTNRNTYGVVENNTRDGFGWGQMYNSSPPAPDVATSFKPLTTPVRLLDTRGPASGGPIGVPTGMPMTADQLLRLEVPNNLASATALVLNVTLVKATTTGYLQIYRKGSSYPGATSVLNAEAGQTRANTVIVPNTYQVPTMVYSSGGGNVIIDVVGTLIAEPTTGVVEPGYGGGRLTPLTPTRILDSRTCEGLPAPCSGEPLASGSFTDLTATGFADPLDPDNVIPADATAIALSVTVDSPAAAGFMSVVPGAQTIVTTSNLNYDAGASLTGFAFVRLNQWELGQYRIFLQRSAHLQVDILGWFNAPTGASDPAGMFMLMNPQRLIDTRLPPLTKPTAGSSVGVDTLSKGVPEDATAVFVNNVSVKSDSPGQVQVSAQAPGSEPFRNLTYPVAGKVIAAATISQLHHGSFVMTPSSSTHLISDLAGYYLPNRGTPAPAGLVTPVMLASDGSAPNADLRLYSFSSNGEFALVYSEATNLDTTPTGTQWFRWERATDEFIELPYAGYRVQMSDDGSTVLVNTTAALIPGDTNFSSDDYIYDLVSPTPTLIPPIGGSSERAIAPDGNSVTFYGGPVRRYDRATGTYSSPIPAQNDSWATVSPDQQFGFTRSTPQRLEVTRYHLSDLTSVKVTVPNSDLVSEVSQDNSTVLMHGGVVANFDTGVATRITVPFLQPYPWVATYCYSLTGDGSRVLVGSSVMGDLARVDAATGDATRIGLTADGRATNGGITKVDLTADGHWALIETKATNLTDQPHSTFYLVDLTLVP